MPCSDAMISEPYVIKPDSSVEDAMHFMAEKDVRSLPVVNENGAVIGLFDIRDLMIDILPISASFKIPELRVKNIDAHLDQIQGSTPWVQKRLKNTYLKKVEDVMNTHFHSCHPETPLREAIRLMTKFGSPLPIVDPETHKMRGVITMQSALASLLDIKEIIKKEEKENGGAA